MIDGVLLTPTRTAQSAKGDVHCIMKPGDPGYCDIVETYFTTINPGAIKAWKRHRQMTLNLVVPFGKVLVFIHDDRKESSTCGLAWDVELSLGNYRLTIPPGLWFGFRGQQWSVMLNLADIAHDPLECETLPEDFQFGEK